MIKDIIRDITPPILVKGYKKVKRLAMNRNGLLPPDKLLPIVGAGDFRQVGESFLNILVENGRLQPNDKVLDVGCGIGRIAIPLTTYLKGDYEGFDIIADGIEWCRKEISTRYPNFHFRLADIHNKEYHPSGRYTAAEYKFPYGDGEFDFVFLISVFTHLLPPDLENYFSEIARVLKPGGRCLISYFILNMESMKLVHAKLSRRDFRYGGGVFRTINKGNPEAGIAYHEPYIRSLYNKNSFQIVEPICYGSWSGRKKFLSYQDIVVAEKKRLF